MSVEFIGADRRKQYLLPPSIEEWLPECHLARFVVEIVSMLDLSRIINTYAGRGSKPFHPGTLLALLFYGYATGVFSSRKLEAATYDSVAFRYICANTHPDHDTIAAFRKRFLAQLKPLFLQILLIAREMGVLKVGKISLDGTKVKANASKHRALSWQHACRLEQQLQTEVAELLAMAERVDDNETTGHLDIPAELARRQARLEAIAKAKVELERRAAERYAREQLARELKPQITNCSWFHATRRMNGVITSIGACFQWRSYTGRWKTVSQLHRSLAVWRQRKRRCPLSTYHVCLPK